MPNKLKICCVYLPPQENFTLHQLTNLTNQLPKPFLLLGDFNSHNEIWGSRQTNRKGTIIENLVKDHLTILNDGTPTHVCTRTGTMSCIDLSICTPRLTPSLQWEVMQHFHGSGHMPIKININSGVQTNPNTQTDVKWNIKKANWDLYQNILRNSTLKINPNNIDETTHNLTNIINQAAKVAIKSTIPTRKIKRTTLWWNPDCAKAIKENKKAFYKYKRHPTEENLINFKRIRAITRRTMYTGKQTKLLETICSYNKLEHAS